jgi:GMP synthase PP-ATPase subunit
MITNHTEETTMARDRQSDEQMEYLSAQVAEVIGVDAWEALVEELSEITDPEEYRAQLIARLYSGDVGDKLARSARQMGYTAEDLEP